MAVWRNVPIGPWLTAWLLVTTVVLTVAGPVTAAAETGLRLTGPGEAEVGSTIEIIVAGPQAAAAIEAAVVHDRTSIDFGGVYFSDDSTRVLSVTNHPGWIDVGGYRCDLAVCSGRGGSPVDSMTLRFVLREPGDHTFTLARGLAVSAGGTVLAEADGASLTVRAVDAAPEVDRSDDSIQEDREVEPDGEQPFEPLAEGPSTHQDGDGDLGPGRLASDRTPPAGSEFDVTRDERVDAADVVDVGLGWAEARRQGDPCAGGSARLDRLDIDGSGCIDVADLVAVAVAATAPDGTAPDAAVGGDLGENGANAAGDPADRAPMVVNSTSDEWDRQLSNEICDTASGVCSLRAALHQANWNPGPDTIHFDIPGAGPHRITLGEQLYITDTSGGVTIDGFTQPGAQPNTDPYLSNASIRIEVRGQGYGRGTNGIVITSPDNVIRGLAIYRSFSNIRLTGANVTGNRLVGNHIGTNASATHEYRADVRDQAGVEIVDGASSNVIGTPDLADRNVISGNPYSGVRINHAATTGNLVQNNLVGLRPSGNGSLYTRVAGIDVQWGAKETLVGGYQEHAGNVVTGVANYGIDLSHSSKNNLVVGNRLGTDATGTRVFGSSGNLIGLAIKDNAVGNTIEYNVIGGNVRHGVWHRHNFTGPNTFRYNRIGIGLDGSNVGNDDDGIYLSGHDDTYERNIIAYNGDEGVSIQNYNGGNGFSSPQYTERNRVTRNSIFDNNARGIDIFSGHNGISRPSISGVGTGVAQGTACRGCTVELYLADGSEGRRYLASTTASGSGSWGINDPAIDDTYLVALAIASNGDTSEFSSRVQVGTLRSNTASTIAAIADRTIGEGQWDEVTPTIGNPDDDFLVLSAMGLPRGMAIDPATGRMYGRPSTVGTHKVTVAVDDGDSLIHRTFRWMVTSASAPAVIGDRVEYADGSPAPGVGIDLFSEGRAAYLTSTTTDGSGTYRFDVEPGCYSITFVAPTGASFDTGQYRNAEVCVGPGETNDRIDAVLLPPGGRGTAIGGRVADQGDNPRAGVGVDLFAAAPDGSRDTYLQSANTAPDGTYRFDLAAGGCYVVVLIAPNGETFTSGSAWSQQATCVDRGAEDLGLGATIAGGGQAGATISGVVTTAAGSAPPTVAVDLFQAAADGSRGQWLGSTTTDGGGRYSLATAPACHVVVFIAPSGFTFPDGSIYRQGFGCPAAAETVTIDAQLG